MLMQEHFPARPPPESQVAQSFATTTNGNPIASPIIASCEGWRQATFWDTQEFVSCGELREATDRFARGREDHLRGARPGLESSVCR